MTESPIQYLFKCKEPRPPNPTNSRSERLSIIPVYWNTMQDYRCLHARQTNRIFRNESGEWNLSLFLNKHCCKHMTYMYVICLPYRQMSILYAYPKRPLCLLSCSYNRKIAFQCAEALGLGPKNYFRSICAQGLFYSILFLNSFLPSYIPASSLQWKAKCLKLAQ